MYGQFYIDQVKGVVFKSGAELVKFLQSEWPVFEAAVTARIAAINNAIDRPVGPVNPATGIPDNLGGLHARSLDFKARMAKRLAASKQ
jgi:hypothetical protein